jgi:hypothetical protein
MVCSRSRIRDRGIFLFVCSIKKLLQVVFLQEFILVHETPAEELHSTQESSASEAVFGELHRPCFS